MLALALVLAAGAALRLYHLGTFGLWWDEIVHVWTSQGASLADVAREVKQGIPPGAGNAGAVPLDYLLLHLFLRWVPAPAPEHLETYFRLPSFVYSVLSLPLLYAFAARFLERPVALLATLLLATSIPHVLYAAEARFYSLFVLMTLVNLYAFARVVERRDAPSVWLAYGVVNVAFFLAGLFAVIVLAVQYAILAVLVAASLLQRRTADGAAPAVGASREGTRSTRRAWGGLAAFVASGVPVAATVAVYLSGTALDHKYRRNPERIPTTLGILWDTLLAFSSGNRVLFACLLLVPLPLVWAWRRRRAMLPLVLSLQLTLLAIPAIVELARWKRYYFHPRHALFLLPAIEILTAIALLVLVRALDPLRWLRVAAPRRDAWNLALACALVLATQLPAVRGYLSHPERHFARSKKTYDLRGVTQAVRDATRDMKPPDKYLLIVQRNVMANVTLAQYLRWYGLGDRVVLRGTHDPAATLRQAVERCGDGSCAAARGLDVDRALGLAAPFGLPRDFQRLLGLLKPIGTWPGKARRIGVASYSPLPAAKPGAGYAVRPMRGVQLAELPR